MKVAFDTSFLTLLLNKKANASVPNAYERVDALARDLAKKRHRVIIPAPSLTEVLLKAGPQFQSYLAKIQEYNCFQVKPFDEKAAIELAERLEDSIKNRRRTRRDVSKIKITFDRQIVAIACANEARAVYSDDGKLRAFAIEAGMNAYSLADIAVPAHQSLLFPELDR